MYHRGILYVTTPPCDTYNPNYNSCDEEEDHTHAVDDSRDDKSNIQNVAYLPHSCDNWVIGGSDEIRALIADLQDALKKLEES